MNKKFILTYIIHEGCGNTEITLKDFKLPTT